MRKTLNKDLKIGQRYWIVEKNQKYSKFARPLLFIGYIQKRKTPWFTFGDSVEDWKKNINYIAPSSKHNYYAE